MLCVDNADSADSGEILGEVAKLAGRNGWLVVTSRRGGRGLWPGMIEDQMLRLEPLSQEEAMAVLWRWGKGKPRNLEDDGQVFFDMDKLKEENWAEYGALAGLAGVDEDHGLGRLPLALVQAGSFIWNAGMSFEGYAGLYEGKWNEVSEVLETAVDCGVVHSDQKAIWTTWKVSMEGLDEMSRKAIRAVAMLGVGEVPGYLMRHVVNECGTDGSESNESSVLFFRVKRKLVNGSSLLNEEAERGSFRLHPLIRQYVRFEASLTRAVSVRRLRCVLCTEPLCRNK